MVSYPETSIDHLDLLLQVANAQNITSSTATWLAQLGECWTGGQRFEPRPDQHSGSLSNWEQSAAFEMTSANG